MLKNTATKENFKMLTKKKPEKRLLLSFKKKRRKSRHRKDYHAPPRGGAKRLYRIVDFGEGKIDIKGKVISLEYDPNRTSFIMLVEYADGDKKYRLAPSKSKSARR